MTLTDEHITEFRTLYRKNFGLEITKEEALEKGLRLVRLMEIITKHEARKRQATQAAEQPVIS